MKTKKHYVTFVSPGTFVSETSQVEVPSWDVRDAVNRSKKIVERYGAKPFGFRFSTVELVNGGWEKKTVATSPMYYLGGNVLTLEQVKARRDPKDEILISNMEMNGYKRVIENCNSYKATLPLNDDDIVL